MRELERKEDRGTGSAPEDRTNEALPSGEDMVHELEEWLRHQRGPDTDG